MIPTPRPYQRAGIAATYAAIKSGKRRPLLVAPTGAGKTLIMAMMIRDVVSRGKRAALFAHRRELRDQAVATLARCGVEAGHSGTGRGLPVQVVSTQGATSCEEVPEADVVFLDEAHHYAADDWGRLPAAYPEATIIGATATPERADGRALDGLFDDLIVVAQPRDLNELWHQDPTQGLVDCEITRPGRVQPAGYLVEEPVAAYKRIGAVGRNVVFASTVEQARTFCAQFIMAGIDARIVHGGLSSDERERNLAMFASGQIRVLINVFVLTEGWDCPAVEVVTLARKMGSCGMFMQATGRGLRPAPGKTKLQLLDLTGVTHLHGSPLDDRIFSLDGVGMMLASQGGPRFCRACGELLGDDGPCPRCKRSRRQSVSDPKYSRDPMEKFARLQQDDEAKRAERLAKWIREARAAGHNPKRAEHRYRGTYGAPPPPRIVAVARALAMGEGSSIEMRERGQLALLGGGHG